MLRYSAHGQTRGSAFTNMVLAIRLRLRLRLSMLQTRLTVVRNMSLYIDFKSLGLGAFCSNGFQSRCVYGNTNIECHKHGTYSDEYICSPFFTKMYNEIYSHLSSLAFILRQRTSDIGYR